MKQILKKMDEDKRDRIINSALEEFSKNDFDKASTNNIVKNAKISKGLLYHYFESKKKLYEFLQEFVIKTIIEEIEKKTDWNESDIFTRIKQISMIKLELCNKYPYILRFSTIAFKNKTVEEIKQITESFSPELYQKVYSHNIDFSCFKEGIDIPKVINIIRWTLERFSEEERDRIIMYNLNIDYKEIEDKMNEYIEILKKAFYK